MTHVLLYSPANLNVMDGSSIWVQSVAETFAAGPDVRLVLPLKAPERRDLITGALRSLDRVEVLAPERFRARVPPSGLDLESVLDWVERLDREDRFDIFVLRGFEVCLSAAQRKTLRGRLWSTYILEPERDFGSSTYLAEMAAIADASEYVVCQSEGMRTMIEHLVPATRGRTILLPPAIPATVARADPARPMRRLVYTGKFHPFYPVPDLIGAFVPLRERYPGLEFHVVGDKIWRTPDDHAYADALEAQLAGTEGLAWHGAISRSAVATLLAQGGIALSVWDRQHGSRWNDLVVSTKLLDYCAAGLPVVLNRTVAQEAILGPDYPLFIDDVDEVSAVIDRLLGDDDLYVAAAERCWAATRRFTYEPVFTRLAPFLARPRDARDVEAALLDRAKLPGAAFNLGLRVGSGSGADVAALRAGLDLLRAIRLHDDRFRLRVFANADAGSMEILHATTRSEPDLDRATSVDFNVDLAAWLMTIGWLVIVGEADDADSPATSGSVLLTIPIGDGSGPRVAKALDASATRIIQAIREDRWPELSAGSRNTPLNGLPG